MRVTFSFPATLQDADTGEPAALPPVEGLTVCDDRLDKYLPTELADAGVSGGEVSVTAIFEDIRLDITFWVPQAFSDTLLERLRNDTVTQLEDGIGESGFVFEHLGQTLVVEADTEVVGEPEIVDDGKVVRPPPQGAIAARDGDSDAVASACEREPRRVNELYQGYSALHYAILGGRVAIVKLLLSKGANPNLQDHMRMTPLMLCAVANRVSDDDSRDIVVALLQAGADRAHATDSGETAKAYAEMRGKAAMAAVL